MNYWYSYVRHSASAEDQPNSLDAQRMLVENGLSLKRQNDQHLSSLKFGGEFYDNDISAGIDFDKRPAGSLLLARMQKGDAILSAKWDRMFREGLDFERTRVACQKAGVRLICFDTDVDTFTANGALVSRILVAVATHKRDKQSEDIKSALNAVKHTKGVKICNGTPIGWRRVRDHKLTNRHGFPYARLVIDEEERAECEEIVMRKEKLGWSLSEIARHFNKYCRIPVALKREGKDTRFKKWTYESVGERYRKAKSNYPLGAFDQVDGKNREQLTIEVPVQG